MIKIIFILFFLPIVGQSQEFNGFDNIRINISEEEFQAIVGRDFRSKVINVTQKKYLDILNDWMMAKINEKKSIKVYKLVNDDDFLYWPASSNSKYIKKLISLDNTTNAYYIPTYPLAGIVLNDIFIAFNSGKLSTIIMDYNNELVKVATEKYPPQINIDSIIRVQCKYVLTGAKTEEIGLYHYTEWNNSNSITVGNYDTHFIDCKRDPIVFISFRSKYIIEQMKRKEEEDLLKRKSNELKKADSLKSKI